MAVTLSQFEVRSTVDGSRGGSFRRKWGRKVYEIPQAEVAGLRTSFEPQDSRSSGAVTVSVAAGAGEKTMTASAGLFTESDVGRAVVVAGTGTYIIESYTGTQSVELATAPGTISAKTCVITGNPVWPGDSGLYARRLEESDELKECPDRPTFARVTCTYRTPDTRTIALEDTTRAQVKLLTGGQATKIMQEHNGVTARMIEGDESAAADAGASGVRWERLGGAPNVCYEPVCILQLSYAQSSLSLSDTLARIGKKNSGALTSLSMGAGTALVMGINAEREWDTGSLWFTQMVLGYRAGGWECSSRAYIKAVVERAVWLWNAGSSQYEESATAKEKVSQWIPTKWTDSPIDDVIDLDVTLGTTDLSSIDSMTNWTP